MKQIFYTLFLLCPIFAFAQWTQLGSPMLGEAMDDQFGYTVSTNAIGDVVVAGGYFNDGNGYISGHARVYHWNGATWVQRGADIDGANIQDWSGYEVTIDAEGDRIAVGAIQGVNSISGLNAGTVRVYDWDGTSWNQTGSTIEGIGSALGSDWFGSALDLSDDGTILLIGARLNDNGGGSSGQVRAYEWDGTDWTQLGSEIVGVGFDEAGGDVSINAAGDVIAFGAIGNGNSGFGTNFNGFAAVYEWDGTDWNQRGSQIDGEISGDEFGRSVSLNAAGDLLAVGAPGEDVVSGNTTTTAYVYEWDGTSWTQKGSTLDNASNSNRFGSSVSLNATGTILAVGGASFLSTGLVQTFEWDGTDWQQIGSNLTGQASNNFFGESLELNADGNRLAVGAWGASDIGHVRVFENASIVNLDQPEITSLQYFPNPIEDRLYISAAEIIQQTSIYDVTGQLVFQSQHNATDIELDLRQFSSGTFYLKMTSDQTTQTIKLLKF